MNRTLYASAARSASALTLPDDGVFSISATKMSAAISPVVLLLMDSPSLVGSGVEIASYREGGILLCAREGRGGLGGHV